MTKAQQAAVEQMRRSVKTLRAMAGEFDGRGFWQDAEALHREADVLAEQAEALELDAQPENTEGELLAA
jgi:hypothetical protein